MTEPEGPELHDGIRLQKVLAQAGVASVLIGATSTEQLDENAARLDVEIPPSCLARIDALFPGPSGHA